MTRFLRAIAGRVSSILLYNPRLHAVLKEAFRRLPETIRARQMIYEHLRELGIPRGQDITFFVVGANDSVTNDHLYPFAKRFRWKGILVEPVPPYFAELKRPMKDCRSSSRMWRSTGPRRG